MTFLFLLLLQGGAPSPVQITQAAAPVGLDTVSAPRISVAFVDTPMEDVLLSFADFSGWSVVFGPDVSGVVNAEVRDQPWSVALGAILESHGFAWHETAPGILRVDRIDELLRVRSWAPMEVRAVPVRFAEAVVYESAVRALLSERGSVAVLKERNLLLVRDTPAILGAVDRLVRELDVRPPEVTISATLLIVNRSRLAEMGVLYSWSRPPGGATERGGSGGPVAGVGIRGPAVSAIGNANQRVSMPSLRLLTDLLMGRHRVSAFAEALESAYLSEVEATPQLRVQERHTARILVGERVPVPVFQTLGPDAVAADGLARLQPVGVQFQDVGIRLEVTPQVGDCDALLLDVHAERSGVERSESALGFVFQTQEAVTRVLAKSGETVVLGGLILREEAELRSGLPLLMRIPGLGPLFRLTRREWVERDLVILLTPSLHWEHARAGDRCFGLDTFGGDPHLRDPLAHPQP
jgi:type IV pilus assembly protein PilQ